MKPNKLLKKIQLKQNHLHIWYIKSKLNYDFFLNIKLFLIIFIFWKIWTGYRSLRKLFANKLFSGIFCLLSILVFNENVSQSFNSFLDLLKINNLMRSRNCYAFYISKPFRHIMNIIIYLLILLIDGQFLYCSYML